MVADRNLETLSRAQLIALAKAHGVELPSGNPTKAKIIALLRAAAVQKKGQPHEGL
jgi:hypothetical protein